MKHCCHLVVIFQQLDTCDTSKDNKAFKDIKEIEISAYKQIFTEQCSAVVATVVESIVYSSV